MAIVAGDANIVKLLIKSKAVIDAIDMEGQYPIHIAAAEGHAVLIELLADACKFF